MREAERQGGQGDGDGKVAEAGCGTTHPSRHE